MKKIILRANMMRPIMEYEMERERVLNELQNDGVAVVGPEFDVYFEPVENGWISVKAIKPESYREIIFCDSKGFEYIGTYDGLERFIDRTGEKIENVVAWMPAPEPYED